MSLNYLDSNYPIHAGKVQLRLSAEYFNELKGLIDNLQSGDLLLLMNWNILFDCKFRDDINTLNPDDPNRIVVDQILKAVDRGADARILLWVNTNLFEPLYPLDHNPAFVSDVEDLATGLGDVEEQFTEQRLVVPTIEEALRRGALALDDNVRRNNALFFKSYMLNNLATAQIWRNLPWNDRALLQNRIVINTLDSAFGGCHSKFALVLKHTPNGMQGHAFTGGVDLNHRTFAVPPYHPFAATTAVPPVFNFWHDIMAHLTGKPIVAELFTFFQTLWNANVGRKHTYNPTVTGFLPASTPADVIDLVGGDTLNVQCVPAGAEALQSQIFDPGDGPTAHKIQSLTTIPNTFQLFGASSNPGIGEPPIPGYPDGDFSLRDALRKAFAEAQTYIYVEDQAMQSLELYQMLVDALKRSASLRVILVRGGDPADAANNIADKIVRRDRYDLLDAGEKARLLRFEANYTVHSKLFLIDDQVAIVGSGGFYTRSLTEELEHGVAFIDDMPVAGVPTLKESRKRLWKLHTSIDFTHAAYDDLTTAIAVWESPPAGFGQTTNGGGITPFDWESHTLTPFPDVVGDIARLLNVQLPLEDDIPPDLAPARSEYLKYLDEQVAIFAHMIAYEWPYASWLNPSSLPEGSGLPRIERNQVPVNVATKLAVDGSASNTVTWEYVPDDGLDTTDAEPAVGTGAELDVRFRSAGNKLVVATLAERKIAFIIRVLENSGPAWVARYRGSDEFAMLVQELQDRLFLFFEALHSAGIEESAITLISTYRPRERAYLMASSYQIAQRDTAPDRVERKLKHVPISWVHHDIDGNPDLPASKAAAVAMVTGYRIGASGAAYPSNHTRRTAVDMTIAMASPVTVIDAGGNEVTVASQTDLIPVARSFGIHNYKNTDHWSLSGT